jgi:hypothetical protein
MIWASLPSSKTQEEAITALLWSQIKKEVVIVSFCCFPYFIPSKAFLTILYFHLPLHLFFTIPNIPNAICPANAINCCHCSPSCKGNKEGSDCEFLLLSFLILPSQSHSHLFIFQ